MPESLEPEMSVDEAIELINKYLKKNGTKDSQGRAIRINKDEPDLEKTISLINLVDGFNEQLCDACNIASEHFFAKAEQDLELDTEQISPQSLKEEKSPPPLVFSNPKKRALTEDENVSLTSLKRHKLDDKTNQPNKPPRP